MKASALLVDLFTTNFAPVRASKSTRLFLAELVMQLACRQFGINPASAKLAPVAPECCFKPIAPSLARSAYLVGDSLSVADNAAAALLSPLALIPQYRVEHLQAV